MFFWECSVGCVLIFEHKKRAYDYNRKPYSVVIGFADTSLENGYRELQKIPKRPSPSFIENLQHRPHAGIEVAASCHFPDALLAIIRHTGKKVVVRLEHQMTLMAGNFNGSQNCAGPRPSFHVA